MFNMFPHHLETAGRKGAKCTGIIKARGMGSLNMFPHNRNLSCLVPTMVTHMHFAKHARAGNVFPSLVVIDFNWILALKSALVTSHWSQILAMDSSV